MLDFLTGWLKWIIGGLALLTFFGITACHATGKVWTGPVVTSWDMQIDGTIRAETKWGDKSLLGIELGDEGS